MPPKVVLPRPARGFCVKAELRMTTDGKGIGVFAAEFIPKNTRVNGDHVDQSLSEQEANAFIESLPNDEERIWWLEHFYTWDGELKTNFECVDVLMSNHSKDPTLVTRADGNDYTTRDIHEGMELTEDYRTYCIIPFYEKLCEKYGVNDDYIKD